VASNFHSVQETPVKYNFSDNFCDYVSYSSLKNGSACVSKSPRREGEEEYK